MSTRIHNMLLIFTAIQLLGVNVHAQKLNDTLNIEEIRIHSVRPVRNTSLTVTRLDSIILKSSNSHTLSEILAEHSGIFIKTYGRGSLSTASFRGTDASHTKVLWNGIELNSPMLGMVDFSQIPMFFVDKVELLHGTSSISESSGALGGIISMSTEADWKNRFSGSVVQGAGSYNSHDEQIRIDMGNTRIQSQTRIFYTHSDNDFRFENRDIIDSIDLETGKQFHPEMKNEDGWFSIYGILEELHFRLSKSNFLNVSFWGQESSRSIPLLSTREGSPVKNRQDERSIRSFLSFNHYGNKLNLKFFSGLSYVDQSFFEKISISGNPVQMRSDPKNQTSSLFNKLDLQYQLNDRLRMDFAVGADFHQVESFEKITLQGYSRSRVQSQASASLYKNWSKRWKSTLKAEADIISDGKAIPVFFAGSEYHILPDSRLYLKVILASNAKFPSLNDLYYQPWGNTSLKPERSMDQEFGAYYKFVKGNFEFSHDFTFYMSQVNDWIQWKYVARGFSPENIERVDIKGIENNMAVSYKSAKTTIRLSSGYALTHSRDKEQNLNEFDFSYGKQLPYIPVHSANAMLYFMRNNWSVTYIWNYYSERNTTSSNQNASPGDNLEAYFMNQLGFGKTVQLGRLDLDMNLKVHNLFNENYMSILQRPMPGRNYGFQLRLNF